MELGGWWGREDLGGTGRGKPIIGTYCMKNIFNKDKERPGW